MEVPITLASVAIMNTTNVNCYNNRVFLFLYSNTGCCSSLCTLATEVFHVLTSVFIFHQGLYITGVLCTEYVVIFTLHTLHHYFRKIFLTVVYSLTFSVQEFETETSTLS